MTLRFLLASTLALLLTTLSGKAQTTSDEPTYLNEYLRGFERVTLDPGETTTVSFAIGPDDLSYYGIDMEETVDPGAFDVMVGHSPTDMAASTTLRVTEK